MQISSMDHESLTRQKLNSNMDLKVYLLVKQKA